MRSQREPRLVFRFAMASLLAFVLVGIAAMYLLVQNARERAELVGARHALFVGQSVLAPVFADIDLTRPVTGETYELARDAIAERVLSDGLAVRVKIWRPDGLIVFSDEPALVGVRHAEEAHELAEVAEGALEMGVSDLDEKENTFERGLADKLFFTYAPLRTTPGGPIVAIAEIYQDYSFIQEDIDAVVRRVALIVVAGLGVLYAVLLPIALRASRDLRERNERLAELLEREQRTVSELQDLHRQKDEFVSAASHELRTPLTSIMGSLATLERWEPGPDPAMRDELLRAAVRQAKRLERVVANVLAAAHLDRGGPLMFEPVDLAALTREVALELDGERIRIDATSRPVATDRARVRQLLTCLLDNALKYSSARDPVEVAIEIATDDVRISVTDHGVGIDPAERDRIFERFHQADQSVTRAYGGLGLGLYVANDLVEELGGRIEVESAPGLGSTFTAVLPAPEPRSPDGERVAVQTG